MTLEGSLEAFSLPDIFQLLSFTKKTGALRLSRSSVQGVVYFSTGSVTGASSDTGRQALARRLVGAGLVDDDALAAAVARVREEQSVGIGKALADAGAVEEGVLHEQCAEQTADSVFDLLRWSTGEFAFVADEPNPDDLGVSIAVEEVIAEGRRRLEKWEGLTKVVPSPDARVGVTLTPPSEEILAPDEWTLLALVDGTRSVAELVRLLGRGEFATVSTLASLVDRNLVSVRRPGDESADGVAALLRRQGELSRLEGRPEPAAPPADPIADPLAALADAVASVEPVAPSPRSAEPTSGVPEVVPARPEPLHPRAPEFPEEAPRRSATASASTSGSGGPRTEGSAALAELVPGVVERDPSVNKSLLLRLIAGVRGL